MRRALLITMIIASPLHAATLTLDQYTSALTRIRSLIATGQIADARAEATGLAGNDVASPNGRFQTDSTLIAEVNKAKPRDLGLLTRIDTTLAALRTAAPSNGNAVDQKLLQQLQREQTLPELKRGGDIRGIRAKTPFPGRVGEVISEAASWVADKIIRFVEWLTRLWPSSGSKETPAASASMRWTVGTLVGLILLVLGILAFEVIRRSRKASADVARESAPLASTRDDDPLSRGANEWERYAAQLAAAGRLREAIRAWYHAVLVTLYATNILHFRKGRTNWEYVAAVAPERAWRPHFIELTRRFEEEWYGSEESSSDALEACRADAQRMLDAVRRTSREAA